MKAYFLRDLLYFRSSPENIDYLKLQKIIQDHLSSFIHNAFI